MADPTTIPKVGLTAPNIAFPALTQSATSTPGVISSEQGVQTINNKTATLASLIPPTTPDANANQVNAAKLGLTIPGASTDTTSTTGSTSTDTTPPNNVTLIKPDTGQEYTVTNPTADDITKLQGEGWSISSGNGPASTVSTTTDTPEEAAAKSAVTTAQNEANTLIAGMSKFGVTDSALAAQIQGIQQQWQQRIDQMTTDNASRVGSLNTTGVRLGSQYAGGSGGQFGSIISEEERQGAQRITDLYGQMNSAIAAARQAAQTQNWTIYSKQVDAAQKAQTDATTALKDLQDATQKQTDSLNAQANADRTAAMQKIMDDHTISYQDKQQALAQSTLDEKTKADMASELVSQQNALKGVYNRDADGTIYDTRTGQVVSDPSQTSPLGSVTPGQTGNPLLDANTKKTSTGVSYIDGTNLTGAQAQAVQLAAAKAGIPYLATAGATALNNIEAARNDFSLISQEVNKLNPSASVLGIWRGVVALTHGAENLTQSGPGATDVSSYNAFKESAIKAIQALASGGTGLRINQAEIQTMMSIIPSYNDTKEVAQAKIDKLNMMLTNNEKSLIGADAYNAATKPSDVSVLSSKVEQAKQAGYGSSDIVTQLSSDPIYKDRIASAKSAGYSDDEILNYLSQ